MHALFLIPLFAFLFRLRGTTATSKLEVGNVRTWMTDLKDVLGKPGIFAIMSLVSAVLLLAYGADLITVALFFVVHLGFSFLQYLPEFGKYFPFSPKNTSVESGIGIVDSLADVSSGEIYAPLSSPEFGVQWRTHAMCWRWVVLSIPKFALVALVLGNAWVLLAIPAIGLVGFIYRLAGAPKKAEWAAGAYIGLIESFIIL